jgi:hypothetical protein
MRNDQYCCLGVLATVQGEDLTSWTADERMTAHLSDEMSGGLSAEDALRLSRMNDASGGQRLHSFTEIADYIEANL